MIKLSVSVTAAEAEVIREFARRQTRSISQSFRHAIRADIRKAGGDLKWPREPAKNGHHDDLGS